MKTYLKQAVFIIGLSGLFALTVTFLLQRPFLFIGFINTLFMLSLVILMIGGMMFVIEGGMFNAMYRNFKQFRKKMSKAEQYAAEFEDQKEEDKAAGVSFRLTMPLLLAGAVLFVGTIFFSYFL